MDDPRPDWVKQVLALRPRLIGYPQEDGRWSFEPAKPNSEQKIGAREVHYSPSTGKMRDRIWSGERWVDVKEKAEV